MESRATRPSGRGRWPCVAPFREGSGVAELSANGSAPVVVVGAHVQGLFFDVSSVPREGETVLASSFDEPLDGGKSTNQAVAAARLGRPDRARHRSRHGRARCSRPGVLCRREDRRDAAVFGWMVRRMSGSCCSRPPVSQRSSRVLDRNRELDAARVRKAANIIRSGVGRGLCARGAPGSGNRRPSR